MKDSKLLAIHCTAGISRNGVIVLFAHDSLDTDKNSFW